MADTMCIVVSMHNMQDAYTCTSENVPEGTVPATV